MPKSILHRTKSGKTTIGTQTIKVPKDRSALSVIGANSVVDGGDYRPDGYVYSLKTGKRLSRWLISLGDFKIWEPKLNDPAHLESRRWFFYQRAANFVSENWKPLVEKLKRAGTISGNVKFPKGAEGRIKIEVHNGGVGWNWIKPEEKIRSNQRLVDAYMNFEQLNRHYWYPTCLYKMAFERAVEDNFINWDEINPQATRKLHLVFSNRHYWFTLFPFQSFAYPEDTDTIVVE